MNADEHGKSPFRKAELTRRIIAVFFEVYGELGYGFLETVYSAAMLIALRDAGLVVQPQVNLDARFRGRTIGSFRADLLVEEAVLVELKAARSIDTAHVAQLLNYLRCTPLEIGLLLNFGPRPGIRRLVFDNNRKQPSSRSSR